MMAKLKKRGINNPYEGDSNVADKLRAWKTKSSRKDLECDTDSSAEKTVHKHALDGHAASITAKVVPLEDSSGFVDTKPTKLERRPVGLLYTNWIARQLQFGRTKDQHDGISYQIIPMPLPGEEHAWDNHYGKVVRGRVLLPDSLPARFWDALILTLIIYYAISVPLLYAFDKLEPPPESLEIVLSSVFILVLELYSIFSRPCDIIVVVLLCFNRTSSVIFSLQWK
jgi:hypothetical protein